MMAMRMPGGVRSLGTLLFTLLTWARTNETRYATWDENAEAIISAVVNLG
jgi:hypothetical protein